MKTFTFLTTLIFCISANAGYTLLHSMTTSPKQDLKCNVSVLVDYETAEISIIRLESPGEKFDINNFQKRPKFYENYSRRYPLKDLFRGFDLASIKGVNAKFSFDKGQTLEIIATSFGGQKARAKRNIADFLRPADKSCLLKIR